MPKISSISPYHSWVGTHTHSETGPSARPGLGLVPVPGHLARATGPEAEIEQAPRTW